MFVPAVSRKLFYDNARPFLDRLEREFDVDIHYRLHRSSTGVWLDLDIVFPLSHYCLDQLDAVGSEIYDRLCAWITDFEMRIGAPPLLKWWEREHYWGDDIHENRGQMDVSAGRFLQ